MSFRRFLFVRLAMIFIVLSAVLLITIALLGSTMDDILRRNVKLNVIDEVSHNTKLNASFRTIEERQNYIENQIKIQIHTQGLDEPWYSPKSLGTKFFKTITLDLGRSLFLTSDSGSQDVSTIIMEKLPKTILLFTTSTIIITFIGLYLGAFSASKAGSLVDRFTSASAVFSSSVPTFYIAMMMIFVFAFIYPVFPSRATPLTAPTDPHYIFDLLYHMTLPLLTIILVGFGGWAYIARYFVLTVLNEDFIAAKRAQGISEKKVIYSHTLKNAAPPIIITIGLALSASLGGALLTEKVFNWPGMGMLYFDAISVMDTPVIVGQTYILVLIFLITIFIVDLMYQYFDPRIKVG